MAFGMVCRQPTVTDKGGEAGGLNIPVCFTPPPLVCCWDFQGLNPPRSKRVRELLAPVLDINLSSPRAGWRRVEIGSGGANRRCLGPPESEQSLCF